MKVEDQLQQGSRVRLNGYTGPITRRVVCVKRDTVYVCTDAEYAEAEKQRREPVSVGFKRKHVIMD